MNDTVVPIISVALILVLVYSVISILKPLPPFKRRWQALVCAPLAFFSLGLMSSLMDASTETTSPEIQPSETEVIETKNEPKVEGEGSATYPLQGTSDVEDVLPSLKPRSLDRNQPYRISKETPLMSELDQVNPIPVLSVAKVLDAGSIITVTAVSEMGGSPWYKVDASDAAGSYVGTGWINSTALLAQNLEPFVPNDDPEPSLPIEDTEASLPIKDTEASLPKNDTEGIALTKRVQQMLSELGYKPGPIDGLMGPKTRSAIQAFQKTYGMKVGGRITDDLMDAMLTDAMERLNADNQQPGDVPVDVEKLR